MYSGLNLNQDKARQRRTGLKLIHYTLPINQILYKTVRRELFRRAMEL